MRGEFEVCGEEGGQEPIGIQVNVHWLSPLEAERAAGLQRFESIANPAVGQTKRVVLREIRVLRLEAVGRGFR